MPMASVSYLLSSWVPAVRSMLIGVVDERFIVLREKSCGRRASARHIHTIRRRRPPTVGKVWRRLGNVGVLLMSLVGW